MLKREYDKIYASLFSDLTPVWMLDYLLEVPEVDAILPIPMYQTAELANTLANNIVLPDFKSTGVPDGAVQPTMFSIYPLAVVNPHQDGVLSDEDLMDAFFPDGYAPDVIIYDESGLVSAEYQAWFESMAQELGLLDPRIFRGYEDWRVYPMDCDPSGDSFRVFHAVVELEADVITEAQEYRLRYDVVRESSHYEDRKYMALYVTDPSLDVEDTVRIHVTFERHAADGDFRTELEHFLAGVTDLSVDVMV
jgi:hypothetical protein